MVVTTELQMSLHVKSYYGSYSRNVLHSPLSVHSAAQHI